MRDVWPWYATRCCKVSLAEVLEEVLVASSSLVQKLDERLPVPLMVCETFLWYVLGHVMLIAGEVWGLCYPLVVHQFVHL